MDAEGRLPIERELFWRLDELGQTTRAELLRVLTLPDEDRATRIGTFYALPQLRTMAELLINLEDDPASRAIVTTELRIMKRQAG